MDKKKKVELDKPIPTDVYPVIDNDLARDNIENNIPAADLEDLEDSRFPSAASWFYF